MNRYASLPTRPTDIGWSKSDAHWAESCANQVEQQVPSPIKQTSAKIYQVMHTCYHLRRSVTPSCRDNRHTYVHRYKGTSSVRRLQSSHALSAYVIGESTHSILSKAHNRNIRCLLQLWALKHTSGKSSHSRMLAQTVSCCASIPGVPSDHFHPCPYQNVWYIAQADRSLVHGIRVDIRRFRSSRNTNMLVELKIEDEGNPNPNPISWTGNMLALLLLQVSLKMRVTLDPRSLARLSFTHASHWRMTMVKGLMVTPGPVREWLQ